MTVWRNSGEFRGRPPNPASRVLRPLPGAVTSGDARMYHVVVDTNAVVSALRSKRGASFRLISTLGDQRWQRAISVALVLEYEEAGTRDSYRPFQGSLSVGNCSHG
jgi:hypothetical protein